MISKKRYWGLALPIWECKECGTFDVIGSEKELKSRAVEDWEDFKGHTPHRPWIDTVRIKCPKCDALVSRITDVGNPWLDAGIVAYSTLKYLHDSDYWERWFPAHFICESLSGQFRNWFYSMLAMSTIMTQRTPFLTCLGHGSVLAEDGREMISLTRLSRKHSTANIPTWQPACKRHSSHCRNRLLELQTMVARGSMILSRST